MTTNYAGRPTWQFMLEAKEELPGVFQTADMVGWFATHYPLAAENTVRLHLRGMSVNVPTSGTLNWPPGRFVFYKLDRTRWTRYAPAVHGIFENGHPVDETGTPIDDEDALITDSSAGAQFALEMHLEEFMEANWEHLDFDAPLQLYSDVSGRYGRQFKTDVGIIDFLWSDTLTGDLWVLAPKRGQSSDRVVGQTLRYMGLVKQHLANGKDVRGLIIAHEADEQLRYAIQMVPTIQAWTYEVSFSFNREAITV